MKLPIKGKLLSTVRELFISNGQNTLSIDDSIMWSKLRKLTIHNRSILTVHKIVNTLLLQEVVLRGEIG